MNSAHFEHISNHEYPASELDVANVMEHLSVEYINGKAEEIDGTNPRIIDRKTKDYTDLGEVSSASIVGLEQEEEVRKLDIEFIMFYHESFK